MPGNGVGGRDHNFFGQENLSQVQNHLETVDRSWPGLSNNFLVENQRQGGFSLIPDLKNYSVQQSDIDAQHGTTPFQVPHGFSFTQPNFQPEFSGSQYQNLQTQSNGYMPGHHFFPAGQNEAKLLGLDTDSNQHHLGFKGFPISDAMRGRGTELQKRNPIKSANAEAPVNFHFLGHQEQMGAQHPAVLQSFHGQQASINDIQLMQQQLMLKQLQDVQRQVLQQQEVWRKSSRNQGSSAKPALENYTAVQLNGIPVSDMSSHSWQSGLTENATWVQLGASAVPQGSSSSPSLSPEQGQGLHVIGLVSQQVDQSVYGVSHSVSKQNPSQISQIEVDSPSMQQISSLSYSFPGSLYSSMPDQSSAHNESLVSKQFQDKDSGLSSGFNSSNLQQVNSPQGNASMDEFDGRQEFSRWSEAPQGKTSSSVASSQSVGTLDPTEERILFGTDDSVWGTFDAGTNAVAGGLSISDGMGFLSGFSSVQSGSWSALMQSALAESSSDNQVIHEEWSGLSVQNAEPSVRNLKPSTRDDGAKQQLVWGDDGFNTSSLTSKPSQPCDNMVKSGNFSCVSGILQSDIGASHGSANRQTDFSGRFESIGANPQRLAHDFSNRNVWPELGHQQRDSSEVSQIFGNVGNSDTERKRIITGSWTDQQRMWLLNSADQLGDRPNNQNATLSGLPGEHVILKNYPREYAQQSFQEDSCNRSLHEAVGQEVSISEVVSAPSVGLQHVQSIHREDSALDNSVVSNLSSGRAQGERIPQLSKSHAFDFWGPIDSSVKTMESEVKGNRHNYIDDRFCVSELSGNNTTHERGNTREKGSLAGGFNFKPSIHQSTGFFKENVWAGAGQSQDLPEIKQNLSVQGAQKSAGIPKFQYHPMGNLDIDTESRYGADHASLSRAMLQQMSGAIRSPGHMGYSNFGFQADANNAGMAKLQAGTKGTERALKGVVGHVSDKLSPIERSFGASPSSESALSRQKIPELLHKVGKSREHGVEAHFSSSDRSELNETETSEGSISHQQLNRSLPMAPSWFEQYATLKNGQALEIHDKIVPLKAIQQPLIVQKAADSLQVHNLVGQAHTAVVANVCNSTIPTSSTREHMSLHDALSSEAIAADLLMKPKKRKNSMSGPLAWHKEVVEGARMVQDLKCAGRAQDVSVAEEEWATAANMLVEKSDSGGGPHEDGGTTRRAKRRLLLSTQLMQLLLRSPLAVLVTADARLHYENVAYVVSRLTLGESCSLVSCSSRVPIVSPNSKNNISEIPELSERSSDGCLLKAVENLVSRTGNLQNDFSRLAERSSVVDLRVECQDLERFSIINRFAKFHGRGQATGTGISSFEGAQKVGPQRYVSAHPMPRNLPDRVQCHAL